MADKARFLAAEALMRVSGGGFSNLILDSMLEEAHLDQRDKAFASALFYGVLERRITLDYLIKKYSAQPLDKLSPEVIEALRLGIYQMLWMDSVPDNAAVNESVEIVKELGAGRASGYVNGILRSFIRNGKNTDFSRLDGVQKLSVEFSAPIWLCRKWCYEYGAEKTKIALEASLGAPPIYIRTNTLKISADELISKLAEENVSAEKVGAVPDALKISGAPQNTRCYKEGLFHVQDISSQLCAAALGAQKGDSVLDVCAAPGGKSFTIAELIENEGKLLSCDLHPKRVNLIKNGAQRLVLGCIEAIANDASVYNEKLGSFDEVLCDVPCSGLGVIRRKPEIRFKNPEDMKTLPGIQYKIASASAKYLKSGGSLVYSTCTLSSAENGDVVKRLINEDGLLPAELPAELKKYSVDGFSVTLMPGEIGSDGFYFARLKRK